MRIVVEDLPGEEWRDIAGYEGAYQVSNKGRVLSLWGSAPQPKDGDDEAAMRAFVAQLPRLRNRILKVNTDNYGKRETVALCFMAKVRRFQVHRLVLQAFVGPCPEGMECRHLDGSHLNNRLENLAWGTREENMEDMRRHGTLAQGESAVQAKLTEVQVREIRAARGLIPQKELAQKYGISQVAVSFIMTRRTWKHVV